MLRSRPSLQARSTPQSRPPRLHRAPPQRVPAEPVLVPQRELFPLASSPAWRPSIPGGHPSQISAGGLPGGPQERTQGETTADSARSNQRPGGGFRGSARGQIMTPTCGSLRHPLPSPWSPPAAGHSLTRPRATAAPAFQACTHQDAREHMLCPEAQPVH